ncbi:hypothetical protein ACU686_37025 [Yinghuangia aomiensis]
MHRRIDLDGPDDELKELAGHLRRHAGPPPPGLRLRAAALRRQRLPRALRTPLALNRTLQRGALLGDPERCRPSSSELGEALLATNERSEQPVEVPAAARPRARPELTSASRSDLARATPGPRPSTSSHAEARSDRASKLRGEYGPACGVRATASSSSAIALNLAQNAVRYNVAEGGWVEVSTEIEHGPAVLTVSNSGPVVPAYEIVLSPVRAVPAVAHGVYGQ